VIIVVIIITTFAVFMVKVIIAEDLSKAVWETFRTPNLGSEDR